MRVLASFASAAICLWATGVAAQRSSTARIEWRVEDSSCIAGDALTKRVETQLGRTLFVKQGASDFVVKGGVARSADGWRAEILLETGGGAVVGERTLTSTDARCSALDDSLALVLALMLDVASEQAAAAPQPQKTTPLVIPPRAAPLPERPLRVQLGLGAVAGVGLLPAAAFGAALHTAIDAPGLPMLEVSGAFWPGTSAGTDSSGVRVDLRALGLFVCPLGDASEAVWVHACAGGWLGAGRASGFGWTRDRAAQRLNAALGVRGRLGLRLVGPLGLRAALGADVPLVRDRYYYSDVDGAAHQLFRAAPVAGIAELGLGVLLP